MRSGHLPYRQGLMLRVFTVVALWMVLTPLVAGQQHDTSKVKVETPVSVLQKFKTALDKSDYATICRLLAEDDGSGPLNPVRYEQAQRSLEGLVNMWRGVPFQYGEVTTRIMENTEQATVLVSILNLQQSVKFVLLKFGPSWYIFDIEIYFK
ncbi:MAG: hypothetical protein HRF44_03845 [Ignavibacterium sp.]